MTRSTISQAVADLVAANRILAGEGVLDGFGHVSMRHPDRSERYLMSRSLSPGLVTAADIVEHTMENEPAHGKDAGKKLYYERWIHGEVYKARPDVNAIVHSHSPTVVPFASTRVPLRPLLHNASFLGFGAPVFEIRDHLADSDLMISTAELGRAMAARLGSRAGVVLLRGHGNVVVAPSLRIAVFRAYYAEINARQQLQAEMLDHGGVVYMSPAECETADRMMQAVVGRPWELWMRNVMAETAPKAKRKG